MANGTLVTLDTLAASQQTVIEFGEDRAFQAVDAAMAAHNDIMVKMRGDLCESASGDAARLGRYGTPDAMSMDEVDEHGRGDAQKISAGAQMGFPMRLFDISIQWTRKYFQNAKAFEFAAQVTAAQVAHRKRLIREIKRALFSPTNYSFTDKLVDSVVLPVKVLANADSMGIPVGPNGEVFDASAHTHYLARVGTLAASDVVGLLETVREHYNTGQQVLYINRAQESAIRGFTGNFTPYLDARIVGNQSANQPASGVLAPLNLYNRAIGIFDGAEVWVKPWIPANYMFTTIMGVEKPLRFRERVPGGGGLALAAEDEAYPLRARTWESEFGIAVRNRTNGAVLYTGGTSYVAPTITD